MLQFVRTFIVPLKLGGGKERCDGDQRTTSNAYPTHKAKEKGKGGAMC